MVALSQLLPPTLQGTPGNQWNTGFPRAEISPGGKGREGAGNLEGTHKTPLFLSIQWLAGEQTQKLLQVFEN